MNNWQQLDIKNGLNTSQSMMLKQALVQSLITYNFTLRGRVYFLGRTELTNTSTLMNEEYMQGYGKQLLITQYMKLSIMDNHTSYQEVWLTNPNKKRGQPKTFG